MTENKFKMISLKLERLGVTTVNVEFEIGDRGCPIIHSIQDAFSDQPLILSPENVTMIGDIIREQYPKMKTISISLVRD